MAPLLGEGCIMSCRTYTEFFTLLIMTLVLCFITLPGFVTEALAKPQFTKLETKRVYFEPPPQKPAPKRSSGGGRR
jgi:hypothetical protein